jgi:hypothetical protein
MQARQASPDVGSQRVRWAVVRQPAGHWLFPNTPGSHHRRTTSGHRQGKHGRCGAAAVEFAVCLPVIVLIICSSIEACSMIFLQQALQTTAYETVRVATSPLSEEGEAMARGQQILIERDIEGATIQIEPADTADLPPGSPVTVTVTAPSDAHRVLPTTWFFNGGDLTAECYMLKG